MQNLVIISLISIPIPKQHPPQRIFPSNLIEKSFVKWPPPFTFKKSSNSNSGFLIFFWGTHLQFVTYFWCNSCSVNLLLPIDFVQKISSDYLLLMYNEDKPTWLHTILCTAFSKEYTFIWCSIRFQCNLKSKYQNHGMCMLRSSLWHTLSAMGKLGDFNIFSFAEVFGRHLLLWLLWEIIAT